jgi:hypothetical protein
MPKDLIELASAIADFHRTMDDIEDLLADATRMLASAKTAATSTRAALDVAQQITAINGKRTLVMATAAESVKRLDAVLQRYTTSRLGAHKHN